MGPAQRAPAPIAPMAHLIGIEGPLAVVPDAAAAGKVARADIPGEIGAEAVELGDAALTRVVVAARRLGAQIESRHGVPAERPVGHCGYVEEGGVIGLRACRAADPHAALRLDVHVRREERVRRPLVPLRVHVALGAERARVGEPLGSLVNNRAHLA